MDPEITNDRAMREWQWLCDRVGEAAARAALARAVQRGRRAYPLNAARELNLRLPPPEQLPELRRPASPEQIAAARARLQQLREEMRQQRAGVV